MWVKAEIGLGLSRWETNGLMKCPDPVQGTIMISITRKRAFLSPVDVIRGFVQKKSQIKHRIILLSLICAKQVSI